MPKSVKEVGKAENTLLGAGSLSPAKQASGLHLDLTKPLVVAVAEPSKADMKFVNEQLRRNAYTKAVDSVEAKPDGVPASLRVPSLVLPENELGKESEVDLDKVMEVTKQYEATETRRAEVCSCGNVFALDAVFCRKCGSQRGFELPAHKPSARKEHWGGCC